MADNNKNKQSNESSSKSNPMKLVKTTSLPTKHEFASDQSKENAEKRNKE